MSYAPAYIETVIRTARANPGMSNRQIAALVGPDARGKIPSEHAVWNWLNKAGLHTGAGRSMDWTDEERTELLAYVDGGLGYIAAARRFRDAHGKAPNAIKIKRWHLERDSQPAPLRVVDVEDSYQRAWDAADGLEGAAWAETVMRAWFGQDNVQASEPDVRVISTRRRAA